MCGIAGIIEADDGPIDLAALRRMDRRIAHRGPDDDGIWVRPGGGAAFAHRRLSILDLSAAGHQPFVSGDGQLVATYNGEIYNFRELRAELEADGHPFRSASDTEVILAGYRTRGAGFIERLRGMFAFAIWDERTQACVLARDRFGIKPLYYSNTGGRLRFASEVRALVASRQVDLEPDMLGVERYLESGSVPEPHTLLRDVRVVEAGHIVEWRRGELTSSRYWSIDFEPTPVSWDDAVERARSALLDSVRHHFVSDVPVGVFLSGGVDSTALVALAREAGVSELHTFSLALPGHEDDEGRLAARSAARFQTMHHQWPLDAATGRDLFSRFVASADQPSIDGLNTFAVSKFARDNGLKVVLSGLGADELFGGYKSFTQVPLITRGHRAITAAGVHRRIGGLVGAIGGAARWRRLGESLAARPSLDNTLSAFRGIFTRAEARRLAEHLLGRRASPEQRVDRTPDGATGDAMSMLELTGYMRNQLLRDADVASMAWGLELRVPFLDGPLFDVLRHIPTQWRLREGKALLKAAVPELPIWIVRQPKRGFLFPFEQWLNAEWQDTFHSIDRSSPVPTEGWYRKWCLFMLVHWMETLKADTND